MTSYLIPSLFHFSGTSESYYAGQYIIPKVDVEAHVTSIGSSNRVSRYVFCVFFNLNLPLCNFESGPESLRSFSCFFVIERENDDIDLHS